MNTFKINEKYPVQINTQDTIEQQELMHAVIFSLENAIHTKGKKSKQHERAAEALYLSYMFSKRGLL